MKTLWAVICLGLCLSAATAAAQSPEKSDVGEVFVLSLGGKLYDTFYTFHVRVRGR